MISVEDTVLVVVDVQTKLMGVIPDAERIIANVDRLTRGAEILGLPVLITEQLPDKLGPTVPSVTIPAGTAPIAKHAFSCWGADAFQQALASENRKHVVLAGVETHVCVYQTAIDLLDNGYQVSIVADAVSSRAPANRDLALQRMQQAGAFPTCIEMLFFELLKSAQDPAFKAILQLIK